MNEYASNLSVFICGFIEFILIAYIYGKRFFDISFSSHLVWRIGFNNFMEDIRMMLNKRPLEPFWFFTWCISGPILILVNLSIILHL